MNSTKTLLDVGIRELALGGAVYQIDSVAASGGLSIVYKAHKRGVNEASVLVKEYWPHEAGAERAEDGSLALPDGTATHQALAYRESDAAQELRKATRDGYADDWFQKYSEPFKANGTVYTVIEAVSGTMLSELIDQKTFGLSAACEQVLRVAEALEHIHRKGFLHLDIKPENIHVSDMEVGHKRVARLIDYNTAWKIGEAPPEIRTTLKGYSAPELLAKRDLLFATDIYSLAALLFCLLAGRAPTGEDIRLLSCETWDLAPLAGMGADTVKSVKMFLSENLASMPCKRSQSLADVSNRLKDIISMAKKPALFNTPHFEQTFAFAGREREFAEIDRLLEQSNWLVVCGLPGIGKTELVRAYANSRYGQLFDSMQLVSFSGSLMETTLKLKLRNFDAGNLVFEEMIGVLSDLGRRSLVIVDGYDVLDDLDFTALVSNECRFLFTSDVVHDELGAYELKAIDDDEALMEIFARAYGAGSSEKLSGLSGIREMLKCVNGHAMLVSLMAKTMRRSGKCPDEMLEILRKSENTGMPEAALRMLGIESQQERDIYDKFYALFRIGGVEADPLSAQVMANLSLLPLDGVDLKRFQEWTGLCDMPVIERLASLGWVNQESVSLHKIVSGIAFAMLAPDSVKCSSLVEGITRLDEPGEAINIMRFACGRVTDPTRATAGMLRAFVSLLSARQSIHGGELAFLSELFSDPGAIEIEQVASYFRIALLEGSETWLDHAQAFMLKLESQGRIPRGASNPVAWRLRAMYWQERGDQEKAYECLELAKRRNPETAMASCEKGFLALKDWNPEEALKHFEASITFCNECFEPIPGFYAHLLAGKGRALAMKGYAKEAWPILAEAAKAQEALFGGSREETANTCELLAKTLLSLDNSKDAEAFAGKAAALYESALGTRNEKTVQARAFLGELRNRSKGRAGKASAAKALHGSADLEKRVLSSIKLIMSGECYLLDESRALAKSLAAYILHYGKDGEYGYADYGRATLKARDILVRELGKASEIVGLISYCLGMLCSFNDDPDMAVLLRLAIFEFKGHDQYNLYNADALLTLGSTDCASHSERLENLAKAKKAFEEAGFKRKIPHVLFHMAVVRLSTNNPEMALPLTKKAYSMFLLDGDKYMAGSALALHGVGLRDLDRDRESLSASKKALLMLAEFDDKEMIENLNELIKELEDLEDLEDLG